MLSLIQQGPPANISTLAEMPGFMSSFSHVFLGGQEVRGGGKQNNKCPPRFHHMPGITKMSTL